MGAGASGEVSAVTPSWIELSVVLRQTQWALDDVAYRLPSGRMSTERCEELAVILEQVAALLRKWAVADVSGDGR
jgi:hypothetical protein